MKSEPVIQIDFPGIFSSVQDSGREGFRHLAIPKSGFLDPDAARLANFLVGNESGIPAIEIIGGTFQVTVLQDIDLGICGADIRVTKNSEPINPMVTLATKKGDSITVTGHVSYLAIPSGFQNLQEHFGSTATYPLARLGGLDGLPLKKGVELFGSSFKARKRLIPSEINPKMSGLIRIIKGPEFHQMAMGLIAKNWTVSNDSSRVGMRLLGNNVPLSKGEMNPVPVFPGTIQLTPSGQPIVLLADAQTTGGYPRVAQVIQADMPRLGRLLIGGSIKFTFVEINEAKDILRRKNAFIKHALEKSHT